MFDLIIYFNSNSHMKPFSQSHGTSCHLKPPSLFFIIKQSSLLPLGSPFSHTVYVSGVDVCVHNQSVAVSLAFRNVHEKWWSSVSKNTRNTDKDTNRTLFCGWYTQVKDVITLTFFKCSTHENAWGWNTILYMKHTN